MVKILYTNALIDELNLNHADALSDAILNFERMRLAELVALNTLANKIFGESTLAACSNLEDNRLYFRPIHVDPKIQFYMMKSEEHAGVTWWREEMM